jgi:hypothetical protein
MFWLAEKVGVERKLIVLAACACAREALVNVPAGEYRPRYAIEMAEAWCRGEATLEQVRCASHAAYDASTAASTAAAYAAYAASASSSAASAASSAASAASAYDARTSCAHIRRVISFEILREASGR